MRSASPGGGGAGGAAAEGGDDSGSRGYTALNVPNTYLSESSVEQVKDLLTARAVRTVLVYMTEFHDGIGAKWLRSFHDFDARERGGTFSNSDAYLLAMLTAPPRTITVSAGYGRSPIRREYTMDIVPSKYAARVLAARRALAAEWVADLARIDADNAAVRVRALERSLRPVTRRRHRPPRPRRPRRPPPRRPPARNLRLRRPPRRAPLAPLAATPTVTATPTRTRSTCRRRCGRATTRRSSCWRPSTR